MPVKQATTETTAPTTTAAKTPVVDINEQQRQAVHSGPRYALYRNEDGGQTTPPEYTGSRHEQLLTCNYTTNGTIYTRTWVINTADPGNDNEADNIINTIKAQYSDQTISSTIQ